MRSTYVNTKYEVSMLFPKTYPRLPVFKRHNIVAMSISGIAIACASLFIYSAYAQSTPVHSTESPRAQAHASVIATGTTEAAMREFHIANNGLVTIRGARVDSNEDGVIHVSISWPNADLKFVFNTHAQTKFFFDSGEKAILSDIKVGDIVSAMGMMSNGGMEPTIEVGYVRQ